MIPSSFPDDDGTTTVVVGIFVRRATTTSSYRLLWAPIYSADRVDATKATSKIVVTEAAGKGIHLDVMPLSKCARDLFRYGSCILHGNQATRGEIERSS